MAREDDVKVCPICGKIIEDRTKAFCSNRCMSTANEKVPKQVEAEVAALMRCYQRRDWEEVEY